MAASPAQRPLGSPQDRSVVQSEPNALDISFILEDAMCELEYNDNENCGMLLNRANNDHFVAVPGTMGTAKQEEAKYESRSPKRQRSDASTAVTVQDCLHKSGQVNLLCLILTTQSCEVECKSGEVVALSTALVCDSSTETQLRISMWRRKANGWQSRASALGTLFCFES